MKKIQRYLSLLDWVLGLGTCVYGLVYGPLWITAVGAAGLVVALFKPAVRIQKYMEKKFLAKKSAAQTATDHETRAENLYTEVLQPEVPAQKDAPPVFTGTFKYGPLRLGASRHNALKPGHLNVFQDGTSNNVPR